MRLKQITLVISGIRIEPHRLATVNYRTHSRATSPFKIRLPLHLSNGTHSATVCRFDSELWVYRVANVHSMFLLKLLSSKFEFQIQKIKITVAVRRSIRHLPTPVSRHTQHFLSYTTDRRSNRPLQHLQQMYGFLFFFFHFWFAHLISQTERKFNKSLKTGETNKRIYSLICETGRDRGQTPREQWTLNKYRIMNFD